MSRHSGGPQQFGDELPRSLRQASSDPELVGQEPETLSFWRQKLVNLERQVVGWATELHFGISQEDTAARPLHLKRAALCGALAVGAAIGLYAANRNHHGNA